MTVSGDGVAFFQATELQSLAIGDGIGGGEGHEVAISVDRKSFDVWQVWRRW